MKNIINILLLTSLFFTSCKSKKLDNQGNENFNIQYLINSIENDSLFITKVKNYYPDFKTCREINFIPDSLVQPNTLKYFSKSILTKTQVFQKYVGLDKLEFKNIVEKYESINDYYSYYDKSIPKVSEKEHCNIKLFFSKKIDNLIILKLVLIGGKIDPNLVYRPREVYYLLELDQNQKIIQRFFVLKSG